MRACSCSLLLTCGGEATRKQRVSRKFRASLLSAPLVTDEYQRRRKTWKNKIERARGRGGRGRETLPDGQHAFVTLSCYASRSAAVVGSILRYRIPRHKAAVL